MGVAENQVGRGHRNLRPTLNEMPSPCLYLKKTFQVYKVKASCSKIDFSVFCLYKIECGPEGGQMDEFRTEIFCG